MNKIKCSKCGAFIDKTSLFCNKCGCSVEPPSTPSVPKDVSLERKISRIKLKKSLIIIAIIVLICIIIPSVIAYVSYYRFEKTIVSFSNNEEMIEILSGVWRKDLSDSYQELCFDEEKNVFWIDHFDNQENTYNLKWLNGVIYFDFSSRIRIDELYITHMLNNSPNDITYIVRKEGDVYYLTNSENHNDQFVKTSDDSGKGQKYYNAVEEAEKSTYEYRQKLMSSYPSIRSIFFNGTYTINNDIYKLEYRIRYSNDLIRYGKITLVKQNDEYSMSGGLIYID